MNEEVRIKNEETGAERLVLATCCGWSAAQDTAAVRGEGQTGGGENSENYETNPFLKCRNRLILPI